MRVALVSYMFGDGGMQVHTAGLANGLVARGCDVCVFSTAPLHGHERRLGYRINCDFQCLDELSVLEAARLQFDVVVVCGVGYAFLIRAFGLALGSPKVYFEVMTGVREGILDSRWIPRCLYTSFVGQASSVAAALHDTFYYRKPVSVIPAVPQDLPQNEVGPQGMSDRVGVRFAYFGRLARHKNVHFLLQNWSDLFGSADCLDIWGEGDQDAFIDRVIIDLDLQDKVRRMGSYPGGDAYFALLRKYDVILLPTLGPEGAPLVLLEAMSAGVPFVANGVGGIGDYANPDCEVTDGDIGKFADAVNLQRVKMLNGQFSSERLSGLYRRVFSPQVIVARWYDLLKGVARVV